MLKNFWLFPAGLTFSSFNISRERLKGIIKARNVWRLRWRSNRNSRGYMPSPEYTMIILLLHFPGDSIHIDDRLDRDRDLSTSTITMDIVIGAKTRLLVAITCWCNKRFNTVRVQQAVKLTDLWKVLWQALKEIGSTSAIYRQKKYSI